MVRMIPLILGAALLFAVPAQARNYDCSKAGNANKAACKGQTATHATSTTTTTTKATSTTGATAARHYDCSKPGNANKAVCKGAATAAPVAAPAPAPKAAPFAHTASTTQQTTTSVKTTTASGPNGATAQCKDGSYSHSATHSGTCSRHGGVAKWF
jgi:hypothetical protein